MPLVLRSSIEHRIIEYASAHYPLTSDELARALHVSVDLIWVELRKMESKGLVELDVLPDRTYVRLLAVLSRPAPEGGGRENKKKGGDDPAYL